MHTAQELSSSSFAIAADGRPADVADVLADLDADARLGAVVGHPCGGVGASGLILAAVTRFYDHQRERSDDFFVYPDYFLFHVGSPRGDHGMLDVWPDHKEVVVADEPEQILRAVNDRGVTHLLVEDMDPEPPELEPATLASAGGRLRAVVAYAPGGRVRDADATVAGNDITESYVGAVLDASGEVDAAARAAVRAGRQELREDGRAVESYRRVALRDGLAMLTLSR